MTRSFAAYLILAVVGSTAMAHDIPDARVDRSIQATLSPGRLRVDYEVGLAELTLAQDLRRLVGELPGTDRRGWFEAYGREVAPLNARGLIVLVDGEPADLKPLGFDLAIEGHPRYTFHFSADVPERGKLFLNDTNYEASLGTSRLALRPIDGVEVRGDALPAEVSQIPIRPVWQLTDEEETRTHRLKVEYESTRRPAPTVAVVPSPRPTPAAPPESGLSRLLDDEPGRAWPGLILAAILLGAAHAIQPGHGKTLVAASSIGPGGGPLRGAFLGLATATAHLSSVALIAWVVWVTRSTRLGEIHLTLARLAGFTIATIGLWRVGRHLGGFGEHEPIEAPGKLGFRSILALGLAGGIVPCWDAVALVVLSGAIGRLGLGLVLLAAFSLGLGGVLVIVGAAASRFQKIFERSEGRSTWEHRLGVLGGLILAGIGISLLR
ncbi:nickel/cobalt transporter [Tundrisphaera lichenicola]|uniref:HoxN/HupN/NixA family nickel/cobalt transporter n=1 Tax=Tundrisphaera lichenicola TaxID=2029860 RepID=UPI003EBBCC14